MVGPFVEMCYTTLRNNKSCKITAPCAVWTRWTDGEGTELCENVRSAMPIFGSIASTTSITIYTVRCNTVNVPCDNVSTPFQCNRVTDTAYRDIQHLPLSFSHSRMWPRRTICQYTSVANHSWISPLSTKPEIPVATSVTAARSQCSYHSTTSRRRKKGWRASHPTTRTTGENAGGNFNLRTATRGGKWWGTRQKWLIPASH